GRGPQPDRRRRPHPTSGVRARPLGGGEPEPGRARRGHRLHLRGALPDVRGRARLGGARPDRLRRFRGPAHRVGDRRRRGPGPGGAAADPRGRARRRGARTGPAPGRPAAWTASAADRPGLMTAAPHTVVEDYLDGLLTRYGDDDSGAVADYIPQLAAADPTRFAIALSAVDGAVHSTGDDQCTFTIQSVSKPFVYALALHYLGREAVAETVDVEPS